MKGGSMPIRPYGDKPPKIIGAPGDSNEVTDYARSADHMGRLTASYHRELVDRLHEVRVG